MIVTFILSLILMASLLLMIWVAVSLVQNPKLFTTAPKDIQAAAVPHKERFPGARILGWFLLLLCVALFLGTFIYAGWDGSKITTAFGSSSGDF